MRDENKLFSMLLSLDYLCQLYMDIGISVNNEIDLGGYSYNRNALDNSVQLLTELGFIKFQNDIYVKTISIAKESFADELMNSIIAIFGDEIKVALKPKLHYSTEDKTIVFYKNSIPLKYAGLFMLLADKEEIASEGNKWLVTGNLLSKVFTPSKEERKMSLEKLKAKLLNESKLGEAAEQFVLEYEKEKLSHKMIDKNPIQISSIDVAAGFDILSYGESENDEKYIEVKSCNNDYLFHFSSNEILTAKKHGENYWLYLFNRMTALITEIQNPYKIFFEENTVDWVKEPDGYVIHKI